MGISTPSCWRVSCAESPRLHSPRGSRRVQRGGRSAQACGGLPCCSSPSSTGPHTSTAGDITHDTRARPVRPDPFAVPVLSVYVRPLHALPLRICAARFALAVRLTCPKLRHSMQELPACMLTSERFGHAGRAGGPEADNHENPCVGLGEWGQHPVFGARAGDFADRSRRMPSVRDRRLRDQEVSEEPGASALKKASGTDGPDAFGAVSNQGRHAPHSRSVSRRASIRLERRRCPGGRCAIQGFRSPIFHLYHSRKPFVVAGMNKSKPLIATGSRPMATASGEAKNEVQHRAGRAVHAPACL